MDGISLIRYFLYHRSGKRRECSLSSHVTMAFNICMEPSLHSIILLLNHCFLAILLLSFFGAAAEESGCHLQEKKEARAMATQCTTGLHDQRDDLKAYTQFLFLSS
jgi:hypothetical protein